MASAQDWARVFVHYRRGLRGRPSRPTCDHSTARIHHGSAHVAAGVALVHVTCEPCGHEWLEVAPQRRGTP